MVLAYDDLLGLEALSSPERATRVYGLLRMFLGIPVEARTKTLSHLTTAVDFLICQAHQEVPW